MLDFYSMPDRDFRMKHRYQWAAPGDLNAFFALFLDNIVNLVLLAGILQFGFGFPKDVIDTYMIPGTALGVMFGDIVYTWLAFRLAKRTSRSDVTAMPLGLDTPSTIGMAVAVLGPAFLTFKYSGMDEHQAAMTTWYVGMGTMIWMGLIKVGTSFIGSALQRIIPAAALLGSLAGIGLVWLSADALIHIYEVPFVGLLALGIILFTLIAGFEFPFKLPGAAMAVLLGCAAYYILGLSGALSEFHKPSFAGFSFSPPVPSTEGYAALFHGALVFLPVAIPFGLMTIVGGINVTEGARLIGDDYRTRDILLTEAFATILAGSCGGVSQSTPYIGHSAYKKMGARAAYTLATGIAVGLGGMFGLVQLIVELIPKAAVAPLLVYIGFEITTLAFRMTPARHAMAVAFAIVPSILNYGYIKIKLLYQPVERISQDVIGMLTTASGSAPVSQALEAAAKLQTIIPGIVAAEYVIIGALGQGFILTAMIWGACAAFLIDRRIFSAAITLAIAALFSFFGLIHSVFPNGDLYIPWSMRETALNQKLHLSERAFTIPYEFSLAYIFAALALLAMYFFGSARHGKGPVEAQKH